MDNLARKILEEANNGLYNLTLWLDQHLNELTLDTAEDLNTIFKNASKSHNLPLAANAAQISSLIFLRLNRRYDALKSLLNYYSILFMMANSIEMYKIVLEGAHNVISKAEEIKAGDLAFDAATLAADSAFFSFETENDSKRKVSWLLTAAKCLVSASKEAKNRNSEASFERFVSLISAVVSQLTSIPYLSEEDVETEEILKRLTSIVEYIVPVNFKFEICPTDSNKAAINLADLSYHYGNPSVANVRLSVAAQRAKDAGDIATWMDIIFPLYKGITYSGSSETQINELRQSILDQIDVFRSKFKSRAGRLWAAQEPSRVSGEVILDMIEKGEDVSNIYPLVEAGKARMLLDQLSSNVRDFPNKDLELLARNMEKQVFHFETAEESDDLSSEIRLSSLLSLGTTWDKADRSKMLQDLEEFYSAYDAGFENIVPISSLSQIMNDLQPDEALIEYCIPHHPLHPSIKLLILVITNQEKIVIPVLLDDLPYSGIIGRLVIDGKEPLDISPLGELVIHLRIDIKNGEDDKASNNLGILYQKLIDPIFAKKILPQSCKKWIIVPHGMLHYVPFNALLNPKGRYLIEDIAITVAPSASVWHKIKTNPRSPTKSFLGFANPILDNDHLPSLEDSEKEIDRIKELLKTLDCNVYKQEKATESMFKSNAEGKSIIHLATHGEFPEEDIIDLHRILLGPSKDDDGKIHADEIRRMKLDSTRLFVLSICNGGLYRFGPGDEPYGLIPAILTAGAENVLGTLWPLEDEIGRIFMKSFYEKILQEGPSGALSLCCQKFINNQYSLLRHWAGFVIVGSGRPLM